jgi:hypothetical protein
VKAPHVDDVAIPDADDIVWDVIEPEPEPIELQPAANEAAPAVPVDRSTTAPSATRDDPAGDRSSFDEGRRYAQLFTRLKRRRRDAALRATIPFADR